ncbi:uncharacterized protein [Symphalangus syndactylus]|uniref:uncharacterized protein n=1 Tax=Symphalangus syndactylus TaxID=9590 RepID=UPI003006AC8A
MAQALCSSILSRRSPLRKMGSHGSVYPRQDQRSGRPERDARLGRQEKPASRSLFRRNSQISRSGSCARAKRRSRGPAPAGGAWSQPSAAHAPHRRRASTLIWIKAAASATAKMHVIGMRATSLSGSPWDFRAPCNCSLTQPQPTDTSSVVKTEQSKVELALPGLPGLRLLTSALNSAATERASKEAWAGGAVFSSSLLVPGWLLPEITMFPTPKIICFENNK